MKSVPSVEGTLFAKRYSSRVASLFLLKGVLPLYGRVKFLELFRLDAYTLTQQRRNNSRNFTLPYKGRTPFKRNSEATLEE